MKLALVTHAEHPKLQGTMPDIWPAFMAHDPVVQSFWPQLYDQYPDFQLWVVDREAGRRATVGYACSVPVGWNGTPSPRGIDWALTDGVEGTPTALCAIVAGVVPEYRGFGIAETILRRLAAIGAGHGLDALVAPVRPTWKDRYPLVALDRYAGWRRGDGLPYDPWLRTHERLGGELLDMAPRSMTISGTRVEWEEWTGMVFPEDGNYVVPGALVPVHFKNGRGVYVEPNIWIRHSLG
jgi:GNAT superfamily N-acetyltransferase